MSRLSLLSSPLLLGFEEIEQFLDRAGKGGAEGYPPYNIERLGSDDQHAERLRITLAVAGFTSDQLSVTLEANQLCIRGRQEDEDDSDYLHRGIAARQFQRNFVLANGIEISDAVLKDGLLSINLMRPPLDQHVKKIKIKQVD
jgi:HSP20 family molecular chaperone IbpA